MSAIKTSPSELAAMKERKLNFRSWLCSTETKTKMYKSICKTSEELKAQEIYIVKNIAIL